MKRRIEPVDLMVAVGVFATIVGGYLFFMASAGTLESAPPESVSPGSMTATTESFGPIAAMQWVQPALGQAVVDNYLLDRAAISEMEAAAKELNRATLMAQYAQDGAILSPEDVSARMRDLDADHAARVQYVLGRSIAVFTARGVRSGALSSTLMEGPYNERMIALTEARGHQMDAAYLDTRESMFGHMIVAAVKDAAYVEEQAQDRLGNAIVRVASLQENGQAKGEAQTQLALTALASIHTEEMAERFDRLASAEQSLQPTATIFSEPRTWPDIPGGLLIAVSLGLIGLFWIGLTMPSAREEEFATTREMPSEPVYRKTA